MRLGRSNIAHEILHEASTDKLRNCVQVSIFNEGTKDIKVMGKTVLPNGNPFRIDPSGAIFDFELKHISFTGITPTENHALVYYQSLDYGCDNPQL